VGNKYVYSQASLPVDMESLAGYVALTGEALLIDDVYHIRSNVAFSFNPAYDTKTGYKTVSLLITPLKTQEGVIVGVLQLINAQDSSGRVVPFSEEDRLFVLQFARSAADTIARARLSQEMVLRMVELAELRDPFETGAHAQRVGAYSAELYARWARKHGIADAQLRDTQQVLRMAAMVHDVGKVAISDTLLRKPSELTPAETRAIRMHTIYGARLFRHKRSEWDRIASEVVLNHHERWDGKGYPGQIPDIFATDIQFAQGKVGVEIPIAARIVSLADVYDALVSERAYKEAWDRNTVYVYLKSQAGRQFDPELVDLFLESRSLFASIGVKYAH
jgi:response regulator RpfG family c-di-GMP phosphodiesterase